MLLANFNGKEHLRHRAVSLRQHGFLVVMRIAISVIVIVMLVIKWPRDLRQVPFKF